MRSAMSPLGVLLIVIGIVGFVYGGINYTKHRTEAKIGAVEIQVKEKKAIPIPPLVGGVCVAGGIILVGLAPSRRK